MPSMIFCDFFCAAFCTLAETAVFIFLNVEFEYASEAGVQRYIIEDPQGRMGGRDEKVGVSEAIDGAKSSQEGGLLVTGLSFSLTMKVMVPSL